MVIYRVVILKQAEKDKEKIKQFPALKENVEKLISLIQENPFQNPPPYEMLIGDLNVSFAPNCTNYSLGSVESLQTRALYSNSN